MGHLSAADAMLGMIRHAQGATGGTFFRLDVVETVATATHCAALVAWSAERGGRRLRGHELAVFGVARGRTVSARFHPESVMQVDALCNEAQPGPAA